MRVYFTVFLVSVFAASGCAPESSDVFAYQDAQTASSERSLSGPVDRSFGDFWYQGKAELTSYSLEQARYGAIHKGHAVLIFVTEDFSRTRQVKLDRPGQAGEDRINVLKLNFTEKFNTGIYPYSMMTSVFTPIQRTQHPATLKITSSAQEWCGHAFSQINLTDDGYRVRLYSYFESEGDQDISLDYAIPEDEIWTTIRLNPDDLPIGEARLIPGTMFQRFRHARWEVHNVTAELIPDADNPELMAYTLTYPDLQRTMTIRYTKALPHEIESWEDTYRSGRGSGQMTTRATRMKRIWLDYWTKNGVEDEALRRELALD